MSDQPPVLRPPTRTERLAKRLRGRWPDSYVHARLDHCDALDAWSKGRDYFEVAAALHERTRP